MKSLARLLAVALLISVLPTTANAHDGSHEITLDGFAFSPETLTIEPMETVTWNVLEDGHTITSEDGLFDWSVKNGESRAHTFEEPGSFGYFCKIHPGMRGRVQVGEPVVPCPDCPEEIRVFPSAEFPTLESAVVGAPPRTTVEIRPGSYDVRETLRLASPGIVLRGTNEDGTVADPSDVVLRGRAGTEVGISIEQPADPDRAVPITVERLTLTGFLDSGLLVGGAQGFRVKSVRAIDNLEYGIRTVGARGGVITGVHASGHRRAGISLEVCESCDIRVEDSVAENNFIGLQGQNSGSLIIRTSNFSGNASGIVLRSVLTSAPHLQQGAHIYDNDLTGNSNIDAPSRSLYSTTEALQIPVGAGIWLQGGWHDVVENNRVSGSHYGIVVTASSTPSFRSKVLGNTLSGNTVDLGWDGAGAEICFSGHGAVTTEPAQIETLYPCGRKTIAGVPYPKVTADLAAYALRNFYCRELDERTCV